jgi:hypothetical protein
MDSILFAAFTLIGIPILIPLNVIGGVDSKPPPAGQPVKESKPSLTKLAIGNIADSWRLWFHLALTVLFSGKKNPLVFSQNSNKQTNVPERLDSAKKARHSNVLNNIRC